MPKDLLSKDAKWLYKAMKAYRSVIPKFMLPFDQRDAMKELVDAGLVEERRTVGYCLVEK